MASSSKIIAPADSRLNCSEACPSGSLVPILDGAIPLKVATEIMAIPFVVGRGVGCNARPSWSPRQVDFDLRLQDVQRVGGSRRRLLNLKKELQPRRISAHVEPTARGNAAAQRQVVHRVKAE